MEKETLSSKIKELIGELDWLTVDKMGLFEDIEQVLNNWSLS